MLKAGSTHFVPIQLWIGHRLHFPCLRVQAEKQEKGVHDGVMEHSSHKSFWSHRETGQLWDSCRRALGQLYTNNKWKQTAGALKRF